MEGKKTLAIKRELFSMGTQHNKLTTLVMVLLGEIEKLKKDVNNLKRTTEINSEGTVNNENTGETQTNLEEQAEDILKQLNLNTKNI